MPEARQWALYAVGLVLAGWMLKRNLWRALLCFVPTALELEPDAPADQMNLPEHLARRHAELLALGFTPLGTHLEHAPLGATTLHYDYGHPGELTFATLLDTVYGPRLSLLSRTGQGFVLTADFRRPSKEKKDYLAGSLESVSPERLFKAHLRRLETLGKAQGECTLEGRVAAGRAWLHGPGSSETRQQNLLGLLWTVGTVGMVAAAVLGRRS
jgi:hypothetical protein